MRRTKDLKGRKTRRHDAPGQVAAIGSKPLRKTNFQP